MSTDLIVPVKDTEVVSENEGPLTTTQKSRLERCEAEIEKLTGSVIKAGRALHEIMESRLYREEFETFPAYCSSRWGFTDRWAYTCVNRFLTYKNLDANEQVEHKPAPDSPAMAEIAKIKDPEKQATVWNRSVEKAKEAGELEKLGEGRVEPAIEIVKQNVSRSLSATEARKAQDAKPENGRKRHKSMKEEFVEAHKLAGKIAKLVDKIAAATGGHDSIANGILDSLQKLKDRLTAWQAKKAEAAKAGK
jgi:hypothetical protein